MALTFCTGPRRPLYRRLLALPAVLLLLVASPRAFVQSRVVLSMGASPVPADAGQRRSGARERIREAFVSGVTVDSMAKEHWINAETNAATTAAGDAGTGAGSVDPTTSPATGEAPIVAAVELIGSTSTPAGAASSPQFAAEIAELLEGEAGEEGGGKAQGGLQGGMPLTGRIRETVAVKAAPLVLPLQRLVRRGNSRERKTGGGERAGEEEARRAGGGGEAGTQRRQLRGLPLDLRGSVLELGYYYVTLYLGSPPQRFALIADTGSSITYVPCAACTHCGNHQDPRFNPSLSASYATIPCAHSQCLTHSCAPSGLCTYHGIYAESSSTRGLLATDVLSFSPPAPTPPSSAPTHSLALTPSPMHAEEGAVAHVHAHRSLASHHSLAEQQSSAAGAAAALAHPAAPAAPAAVSAPTAAAVPLNASLPSQAAGTAGERVLVASEGGTVAAVELPAWGERRKKAWGMVGARRESKCHSQQSKLHLAAQDLCSGESQPRCELQETGDLYLQQADGIVGLGRDALSLPNQLMRAGVMREDVFSLCFAAPAASTAAAVAHAAAAVGGGAAASAVEAGAYIDAAYMVNRSKPWCGKLDGGAGAGIAHGQAQGGSVDAEGEGGELILGRSEELPGTIWTPLHPMSRESPYYIVSVEEMLVGRQRVRVPEAVWEEGPYGGVMLDSGTTFTYLPSLAFHAFTALVLAAVSLPQVPGPDARYTDICFANVSSGGGMNGVFPTSTIVFRNGASLLLMPHNYLFKHKKHEDAVCLGVFDNGNGGALIGGVAVRGMRVTYDREHHRIGFATHNCPLRANAAAAPPSLLTPAAALSSSPAQNLADSQPTPQVPPQSHTPSSAAPSRASAEARATPDLDSRYGNRTKEITGRVRSSSGNDGRGVDDEGSSSKGMSSNPRKDSAEAQGRREEPVEGNGKREEEAEEEGGVEETEEGKQWWDAVTRGVLLGGAAAGGEAGRGELASWFGGSERERLESSGPAEEEEEEETEEEKGEGNSEGGEGKAPSSSSGGSGSVGAIGSVLLSQQRPVIPSHQWWCRHAGSIKEASRQYSSIRWRCKGRSGQRVLSDLEETLQGGGRWGCAGRDGGEQPGSAASGIAVDGEEKRGAAESTLYRHLHLQLVFSGRHAPVLPPVPAHSSSSPSTDPPVPPFLPTLLPAVSAALHVRRSRVGVAAFGSTTLLLPSQATQGAPSTTPLLLPAGSMGGQGDGQGHGGSGDGAGDDDDDDDAAGNRTSAAAINGASAAQELSSHPSSSASTASLSSPPAHVQRHFTTVSLVIACRSPRFHATALPCNCSLEARRLASLVKAGGCKGVGERVQMEEEEGGGEGSAGAPVLLHCSLHALLPAAASTHALPLASRGSTLSPRTGTSHDPGEGQMGTEGVGESEGEMKGGGGGAHGMVGELLHSLEHVASSALGVSSTHDAQEQGGQGDSEAPFLRSITLTLREEHGTSAMSLAQAIRAAPPTAPAVARMREEQRLQWAALLVVYALVAACLALILRIQFRRGAFGLGIGTGAAAAGSGARPHQLCSHTRTALHVNCSCPVAKRAADTCRV
ncbi:hypothetical protein CLOM_g23338 [Closterium sp. NIES-68]|nr:hypothetical protein CLOM_g23338 [Closterium sp. NIES-68]